MKMIVNGDGIVERNIVISVKMDIMIRVKMFVVNQLKTEFVHLMERIVVLEQQVRLIIFDHQVSQSEKFGIVLVKEEDQCKHVY